MLPDSYHRAISDKRRAEGTGAEGPGRFSDETAESLGLDAFPEVDALNGLERLYDWLSQSPTAEPGDLESLSVAIEILRERNA